MDIHHHICGFFATRHDVHATRAELLERGVPRDQLHIYEPDTPATAQAPIGNGSVIAKDAVIQGTIETVVGSGIGALARMGALVGAAMGAHPKDGASAETRVDGLSELVTQAVGNGQFVLVADTRTQQQTNAAQVVMKASAGDYKDVASA
jgi:hypothetical protein